MSEYSLLVAFEVFEFLLKQPRRAQLDLRKRMLVIRDYPRNHSDFIEADDSGRDYHVHLFRSYAIKYWIDDADRQVKIMKVRPADRAR